MYRISNFQIYAIMLMLLFPVPFLEVPKRLSILAGNNAWLALLASIIPGFLIIYMFMMIIRKSQTPFPAMLEEHLGMVLGKILQILYFVFLMFVCAFMTRLFVDFIETNVMPLTPISVHITLLLFVCWLGIKAGIESFARTCEIIGIAGLAFTTMILILLFFQPNTDPFNLLPLVHVDPVPFGLAVASSSSIIARTFPVLTLAFFSNYPQGVKRMLVISMLTYIALTTTTIIAMIMFYGGQLPQLLTFPAFSMIRLIQVGKFIQNIDVFFIGIWIMGIFAAIAILWFMALICLQQAFNLQDYRFLAAPSALILGTSSLLISRNIQELGALSLTVIPLGYGVFFIVLPFLLWLRVWFKPEVGSQTAPGTKVQEME